MRLEVETGGVRTRPHLDRLPSSYFRSWRKPPEMPEEFRMEAFGHVRLFPGKCVFLPDA